LWHDLSVNTAITVVVDVAVGVVGAVACMAD